MATTTLEFKAEGKSVLGFLKSLTAEIERAEKANRRLAGGAKTIGTHYQTARHGAAGFRTQVQTAVAETTTLAKVTGGIAPNLERARGRSIALARSMRQVAADASKAASASNKIGTGRRGGGGGGGIPGLPNLPGGGGSGGGGGGGASGGSSAFASAGKLLLGAINPALGAAATIGGVVFDAFKAVASPIIGVFKSIFRGVTTGLKIAIGTGVALGLNAARLAIKQEPIEQGFDAILSARGIEDEAAALESLRTAARGTVSDLGLMTNANKALALGAADNTEQLEFLITAGRRLGKTLGRTAEEGFEDLSLGIGRQSKLILDNLGLIVKVEDANKAYAKSIGVTVAELTDEEKKLAFQRAAYDAVEKKLKELGEEQLTAGDRINQVKASFTNASVEIGKRFLPLIADVGEAWARWIGDIDPDAVIGGVKKIFDGIKSAAESALDFLFDPQSFLFGDFNRGLKGIGGDIVNAITNPSSEAFKIVAIRAEGLWDDFSTKAAGAWDVFVGSAARALQAVSTLGISELFDVDPFNAKALQTERIGDAANRLRGLGERNAGRDQQIEALRKAIEENTKAEEAARKAEEEANRKRFGPGGGGGAAGITSGTGLERAAKESRERANALKAEEEARKKLLETLKRQESVAREALQETEREIARRQDLTRERQAALGVLKRAVEGVEEPAKTLADSYREHASEIRSVRDELSDFGDDLKAIAAEEKRVKDEANAAQLEAIKQFRTEIQKQAKSFLLGGEVEGTTTRVRSLQRKARREQRRRNRAIFQEEFGSRGFSSLQGGDLGGFGAQGVERQGGVLDQRFPGLERALQRLIEDDGTSQLQKLDEQIEGIMNESVDQLRELNATREEVKTAQEKAQDDLKNLLEEATDIERQALRLIDSNVAVIARLQNKVNQIEADLKNIERASRENARKRL